MTFPKRNGSLAPWVLVVGIVGMVASPTEGRPYYGYPGSEARYARVTLSNQADVPVTFRMRWPGRLGERMTLRPGGTFTAETTFPAGTIQPDLTLRFEAGDWDRRRESLELPSGHVAPYTNNPGRVYDFWRVRTPFGSVIDLRPR